VIRVVVKREVQALFRTPFAWWVLTAVQGLTAYQFLAQIELFGQLLPRLRSLAQPPGVSQMVVMPTISIAALALLFLIPVLTMHSFSGERRAGTLRLWYSAPIRLSALVIGKFVGVMCLLGVIWSLLALMLLTLAWGTTLDFGTYAGGLLALGLLMAASSALGLMFSALASQPTVAAIATFVMLLGLWLVDWGSLTGEPGMLAKLSMQSHFLSLSRGLVDSFSVIYFGVITLAALGLTWWRLHGERRAF
jgi:ABC-2 type transport system permease protein